MMNWSVGSRAKALSTLTFVFDGTAVAWPLCGHWIVQPIWRIAEAIR